MTARHASPGHAPSARQLGRARVGSPRRVEATVTTQPAFKEELAHAWVGDTVGQSTDPDARLVGGLASQACKNCSSPSA